MLRKCSLITVRATNVFYCSKIEEMAQRSRQLLREGDRAGSLGLLVEKLPAVRQLFVHEWVGGGSEQPVQRIRLVDSLAALAAIMSADSEVDSCEGRKEVVASLRFLLLDTLNPLQLLLTTKRECSSPLAPTLIATVEDDCSFSHNPRPTVDIPSSIDSNDYILALLYCVHSIQALDPNAEQMGRLRRLLLPPMSIVDLLKSNELPILCSVVANYNLVVGVNEHQLMDVHCLAREVRCRLETILDSARDSSAAPGRSIAEEQAAALVREQERERVMFSMNDLSSFADCFGALRFQGDSKLWGLLNEVVCKVVRHEVLQNSKRKASLNEYLSLRIARKQLRAVAFALHRVQRFDLYHNLMDTLVSVGILQEHVQPPSQTEGILHQRKML